jgi:hypothetical protein
MYSYNRHPYLYFPFLVPKEGTANKSIIGVMSKEQLRGKVIARFQKANGSNFYGVFENYVVLCNYIKDIPESRRMMHEVILGNMPRKPIFDLDVKTERLKIGVDNPTIEDYHSYTNGLIDELIQKIEKVITDKGFPFDVEKNTVLFSSHGEENGSYKISYHLVVDGFYHSTCYHAKMFFKEVIDGVSNELLDVLDANIYEKNHCMRILWNHKIGSKRYKQYHPEFTYRGEKRTHALRFESKNDNHHILQIFGISVVTMVSACKQLPNYQEEVKYEALTPVSSERVIEALNIMLQFSNCQPVDFPFKYLGIKNGIISLERLRPFPCPICARIHINRPPYLLIHGKNLYWCCRGMVDKPPEEARHLPRIDRVHIGVLTTELNFSHDEIESHQQAKNESLSAKAEALAKRSQQKAALKQEMAALDATKIDSRDIIDERVVVEEKEEKEEEKRDEEGEGDGGRPPIVQQLSTNNTTNNPTNNTTTTLNHTPTTLITTPNLTPPFTLNHTPPTTTTTSNLTPPFTPNHTPTTLITSPNHTPTTLITSPTTTPPFTPTTLITTPNHTPPFTLITPTTLPSPPTTLPSPPTTLPSPSPSSTNRVVRTTASGQKVVIVKSSSSSPVLLPRNHNGRGSSTVMTSNKKDAQNIEQPSYVYRYVSDRVSREDVPCGKIESPIEMARKAALLSKKRK